MTSSHQRVSWSESISLGSTDGAAPSGYRYRRSASVSCLRPGRPDVRRRQGVRLGLALAPTAFAESVVSYIAATTGQCLPRRQGLSNNWAK